MSASPGSAAGPRWRFRYSGTMKGIYVMRYLMFSGGTAIALGMALRATGLRGGVVIGLLLGFLAGLVLWHGQLRAFNVPEMGLGREQLHFVHNKQERVVDWSRVKSISARDRRVWVALDGPAPLPDGTKGESFDLLARDYGMSAQALAAMLEGFLAPERRGALPPDSQVRQALGATSMAPDSPEYLQGPRRGAPPPGA